jgi:hypothetical protein
VLTQQDRAKATTLAAQALLLYYCFTTALLLQSGEGHNAGSPGTPALLLLYYCFTNALLLLYYCFTSALLLRSGELPTLGPRRYEMSHTLVA